MRVKIYTVGKQRVIGEYLTRNVFELSQRHACSISEAV